MKITLYDNRQSVCPVCGYTKLDEPAYDEKGCASFMICPCCGTEFGYDDSTTRHGELRKRWVDAGMKWWSTSLLPPADWNPETQLKNIFSEKA